MSLTETVSPTRERFSKGDRIEAPEYTQEVKRHAYRVQHPFETLYCQGKINEGCKEAGLKLLRHHQGMLGHDIRMSVLDSLGCDSDPHGNRQPKTIYHGQKLAEARKHILSRNSPSAIKAWWGLCCMVEETRTLEDIGREWLGCKTRGQAYIAGLALISMALEDLSVFWNFSQSYHSRNPPSR